MKGFSLLELLLGTLVLSLSAMAAGRFFTAQANSMNQFSARLEAETALVGLLSDISHILQRRTSFGFLPSRFIEPGMNHAFRSVAAPQTFREPSTANEFQCSDLHVYQTNPRALESSSGIQSVRISSLCNPEQPIDYSRVRMGSLPGELRCIENGYAPMLAAAIAPDADYPDVNTPLSLTRGQSWIGAGLCVRASLREVRIEAYALYRLTGSELGLANRDLSIPLDALSSNIEVLPP